MNRIPCLKVQVVLFFPNVPSYYPDSLLRRKFGIHKLLLPRENFWGNGDHWYRFCPNSNAVHTCRRWSTHGDLGSVVLVDLLLRSKMVGAIMQSIIIVMLSLYSS